MWRLEVLSELVVSIPMRDGKLCSGSRGRIRLRSYKHLEMILDLSDASVEERGQVLRENVTNLMVFQIQVIPRQTCNAEIAPCYKEYSRQRSIG